MSKKKKRKKERLERIPGKKEAPKGEGIRSFAGGLRLGLRLLSLALFPFADVFQRAGVEWLAIIFLLGSALVFYEMLDFYRKARHWGAFFLTLSLYILGFGSLMLAIYLRLSWAHHSNIALQTLLTLPRLPAAYYLCKILRQIYPYR